MDRFFHSHTHHPLTTKNRSFISLLVLSALGGALLLSGCVSKLPEIKSGLGKGGAPKAGIDSEV